MWWKTVASSCLYIYINFNIKFWHIPTFFLVAHQTNQKIWSQATPLRLARAQSGGSRCHVSSIWLAAAEWQPHLSNTFFQNGHTIDRCIVCISSQKIMQNRSRSHSHSLSLSFSPCVKLRDLDHRHIHHLTIFDHFSSVFIMFIMFIIFMGDHGCLGASMPHWPRHICSLKAFIACCSAREQRSPPRAAWWP